MTAASDGWRAELEAWELPPELLATATESPYKFPQRLWQRRGEKGLAIGASTPTTEIVAELAGQAGSVLDIGAGTGRTSFPLVQRGHPVTMVEPNPAMLASLRGLATERAVEIVEGRWPEVENEVARHEVALSGHVIYDVPQIVPFLRAMERKAVAGVVIEATPSHPWTHLRDLYLEFHQLDRPAGPTVDDLMTVVSDLGRAPELERWRRPSDMVYESLDQIVEVTGRRLVLPESRWPELEQRLRPAIVGKPGALQLGPLEREIATVWWRTVDSL
ncbi:class I SAM-dependent methyltransferase [soil metagenome]